VPDIPNRDELERILARKLGGLNRRQLARLLEVLGNFEDYASALEMYEAIPPDLWEEMGKEMAAIVIPFSERVYLEAAERMLETVTIGVDWSLVNEAASNWAMQHGSQLVKGINGTTQSATNRAIANFFEQGLTFGDLRDRLGKIYSPVRAEMIAITETTRAASAGEYEMVREIEKEGVRMVAVWQTANDDLVCPICEPRHGKKEGDEWTRNAGLHQEPPAHPRCRCWVNHEFAEVDNA
jgi:hypothetical protein